ncbi:Long chain acyl-CoA synthetase 7 peroxisomal [Gonapodya sp. JEL0774]|nr:Long chain acyl-CoA synthetase 7 peroxisomal [Gonapodya sp. JEL0774]
MPPAPKYDLEYPPDSANKTPEQYAKIKNQGVLLPGTGTATATPIIRSALYPDALIKGWPDTKTLYDVFQKGGLKICPDDPYLGHRPFTLSSDPTNPTKLIKTWGGYVWRTYRQAAEEIDNVGSALVALRQKLTGKRGGQWCFGIYAVNRPEWIIAEQASYAYNAITTVLYDTLGADVVEYIVNHAEAEIVVTSTDKIAGLLKIASKMPVMKAIISMDSLDSEAGAALRAWAAEKNVVLLDWPEAIALGKANKAPHTPPSADDLVTICYTSGTTGLPKGVMLSHENMVCSLRASALAGSGFRRDDTYISYTFLCEFAIDAAALGAYHQKYERLVIQNIPLVGGKVGFFRGDVLLLIEDLGALQPTFFCSVPRLLNRIYDKIIAGATTGSPIKAALFRTALNAKLANLARDGTVTHPLWDRLVFKKVQQVIGGKVRQIVSGSAPIGPDVLAFLRVAFACTVVEGYGQTESTALGFITWPSDMTRGHLGPPAPAMEARLISIPEMNYNVTDKPFPRGEIAMRGNNVTKGYWKDVKKTRELFTEDGFMLTGDVGVLDDRGRVSIIDRKKNIFKLSQGEYVAPEKIEQVYQKSDYVAQIFVHGDSLKNELVAVVVPDFEVVLPLAAKRGWGSSPQEITRNNAFKKFVLDDMDKVGKAASLRGFEFVKAIHLEPELFSIDNGMLTPTQKVKRPEAKEKYQREIAQCYEEIESRPQAPSKL